MRMGLDHSAIAFSSIITPDLNASWSWRPPLWLLVVAVSHRFFTFTVGLYFILSFNHGAFEDARAYL